MRLIYILGIRLYYLLILAASPFHSKAGKWINGRRGLFRRMAEELDPGVPYIWFHCSSLGEFEQGRPVIEKIRESEPGKKILLTFYSPSGFDIRKNYEGADHVFYLPLDTRRNAERFLSLATIKKAYFIKYEYWYHFISSLHRRGIPVYLVSGIFRGEQVFFKWYGTWFLKMLRKFDHLFVQQEDSRELLASAGIDNVTVTGDTRFDRVYDLVQKVRPDQRFQEFRGDAKLIVAGSTWPADEEIILRYINESDSTCKWILAPHEIHEQAIRKLSEQINHRTQIYTELDEKELDNTRVLLIDTIGLLSSLYQYADITYIGGGFGKGIHNTLEAATFGKPVMFGPNYHKFQEAKDLARLKAAFPVEGFDDFRSELNRLLTQPGLLTTSGESAAAYVKSMLGASSRIVDFTLKTKIQ